MGIVAGLVYLHTFANNVFCGGMGIVTGLWYSRMTAKPAVCGGMRIVAVSDIVAVVDEYDNGDVAFLLFGLLAWPASSDASAGAAGVPSVDGLGEPAARASDGGVRLGELVGADGGGADAEAIGHVGDAQVFDGHVSPSFRR